MYNKSPNTDLHHIVIRHKIIITGPPSSGKSSLLTAMEQKGIPVLPEYARIEIQHQQTIGGNAFPWKNLKQFSDNVLRRMEANHRGKLGFITDRSVVDIIAYLNNGGISPDIQYSHALKDIDYAKTVFFAPFWEEIFENDEQRKENKAEALEIESAIQKAYIANDFNLVEVPKLEIIDRVRWLENYILNHFG